MLYHAMSMTALWDGKFATITHTYNLRTPLTYHRQHALKMSSHHNHRILDNTTPTSSFIPKPVYTNTAKAYLTSCRPAELYTLLQMEELTKELDPLDSYSPTVNSIDSATHGAKPPATNQTHFALKYVQPSLP